MKKALILTQDLPAFSLVEGQLFRLGEASEIESYTWTYRHLMVEVEVPADIEDLEASQMKVTFNEISGKYELDKDLEVDKQLRIDQAYELMTKDVMDQMEVVFGTKSSESANAYKGTFDLMLEDPSDYSSIGMTARFDVGSISKGDVLDSDDKVLEYAQGKINDVKAYGVFRMQRIEQFKSEKLAIENEVEAVPVIEEVEEVEEVIED